MGFRFRPGALHQAWVLRQNPRDISLLLCKVEPSLEPSAQEELPTLPKERKYFPGVDLQKLKFFWLVFFKEATLLSGGCEHGPISAH